MKKLTLVALMAAVFGMFTVGSILADGGCGSCPKKKKKDSTEEKQAEDKK